MIHHKNRTWFWIINGLIALLVISFFLLNRSNVMLNFWGMKIQGPGFLVFLVIFVLGVITGWLWSYFRHNRKEKNRHREDQTTASIEQK